MRLFILPISTKHNLIYCARIHQHLPTKEKATYIDKLSRKAATTWLAWEQHNKGWQKVVTTYGNKLFQNLPHEEWGLKSIPPLTARRISSKLNSKDVVRLEFPSSWIKEDAAMESLRYFGGKAKYAYHTKWMWGSIIGMPISAPLALIPIVPNLPFFYLVFRAWSHWRARSGSAHLEFLLQHRLIKLSPSRVIDSVYAVQNLGRSLQALNKEFRNEITPPVQNIRSEKSEEEPIMLLSPSDGRIIAETLEVPELEQEVERAIHQVNAQLRRNNNVSEEKHALDSTAKKAERRQNGIR